MRNASDEEIQAALDNVRSLAGDLRGQLRDLLSMVSSKRLTMTLAALASIDGYLGKLAQLDRRKKEARRDA